MTPRLPFADRADEDEATGCADTDGDDARTGRRRLLRDAGATLSAVLAAGCLSNPWGPARGRPPGDDGSGGESADGTTGTAAPPTDDDSSGSADEPPDTPTTDGSSTTDASSTESPTTAEPTSTVPADEREPDLVVEVAPDGFTFSPETFTVEAGDTVHWEWKDSGHNVRVRERPDGSDWTGTPGSASDTYDEGYLHAFTFETPGEYEYYCAPHQTLGLEGSFTVR